MSGRQGVVSRESAGSRLDRLVADLVGCGRRRARRLINEGCVLLDGRRAVASAIASAGSRITVSPAPGEAPRIEPAGIKALWSDSEMVVLDKPAGVHSHRGRHSPCAADFTAQAFPETVGLGANDNEGGIVHRLDCFTSRVLIAARSEQAYAALRHKFSNGLVTRRYLALVEGKLDQTCRIDNPLVRTAARVRAARDGETGLPACSNVSPLESGDGWSLLLVASTTGAPHQVRAHLSMIGLPLIGDTAYGGPPAGFRQGQLLHAAGLSLHASGSFSAAVPGDFLLELAGLRKRGRTGQSAPLGA